MFGAPLQPNVRLSKDDCPKDDDVGNYIKNIPYASAGGSLMLWLPLGEILLIRPKLLANSWLILVEFMGR